MRNTFLTVIALVFTFSLALSYSTPAMADSHTPGDEALLLLHDTGIGGDEFAADAGEQLPQTIGKLIRAVLGLMGIILVSLMLYAGFMWMTAAGNPEKVEKAKSTITRAVIGTVIILSAYAITGFVISAIVGPVK